MRFDNNIEWSLYDQLPNMKEPILLSPLSWNGGDQLSNLEYILKFFEDNKLSPKTNIMIYKSMCGSGKCIFGDALILTSKGIVDIENIVKGNKSKQRTIEESFTDDINDMSESRNNYIESHVKSLDLNNIKLEDDIISNVFDIGNSEIIDITTKSGFNTKCTPTHGLVVIDNSCNIVFKDIKDILIGDSIAIAYGTEIYGDDVDLSHLYQSDFYRRHKSSAKDIMIPNEMNEELGELLGYAVSEGDSIREDRSIHIYGDEEIIRDRITDIANSLGIKSLEIFDYVRNIYDGVAINSVIFCDFFRYLGYIDGSKNKEVPWSILQSSKKVQVAFLKALFSGDGYVGKENKPHIEYYTISKKLAEQLHVMLLNMGIFSSLGIKPAICVKNYGDIKERKDCGICYRISIFGRRDMIEYINTIGFIQDYKKSRCVDILKVLESKDFSFQSRTINGSYVRLKKIYEEFKKLGKSERIIKTWKEDVNSNNKTWEVVRRKRLSARAALIDRGFKGAQIQEWIDGSYSASKRQILKLLNAMKECYYLEDFKYLYNIATSNIEFDIVKDIKKGECRVYDLTIKNNHSYVGNGFINHNSGTLLHIPKEIEGRAIVVTPFKNLQRQYYDDYFKGSKFILKKDGSKLNVAVILGRNNFKCEWLEKQYDLQQKIIKENEKSENVGNYGYVDDEIIKLYRYDNTCANRELPCTRSLRTTGKNRKESRWSAASRCEHWIPTPMPKHIIDTWKDYEEEKGFDELEEEDDVSPFLKILGLGKKATLNEIRDVYRELTLKYHSDTHRRPGDDERFREISRAHNILTGRDITIMHKKESVYTRLDRIKDAICCSQIKYYESVVDKEVGVFIRDEKDKHGNNCASVCPYYHQFYNYVDADVIVVNDAKWALETTIGRKPKVDVEIFDEGDNWLDKHATTIELRRSTIDKMYLVDQKIKKIKLDTLTVFDMYFKMMKAAIDKQGGGIISADKYKELFVIMAKCITEYINVMEDNDNLREKLLDLETVIKYANMASLSYIQGKSKDTVIIKVYVPYPNMILKDLLDSSSKNIVITSGTMQSNTVLSNLFGINAKNYTVDLLGGRKDNPGKLRCIKPKEGLVRVTYATWQSPAFREHYNKTLNYILDNLKILIDKNTGKPGEGKIIVLTPAKKYAEGILNRPDVFVDFANYNNSKSDEENASINTNISDYLSKNLKDVRKIKSSDISLDGDVLRTDQQIIVSTRMVRGTDLRDNKCRAVVMLKWPIPDISDGYNQALLKRFGDYVFWNIIRDKADREAIQYVSRGLRHDNDWEYFSTPDEKAFVAVYSTFQQMGCY